MKHVTFHVGVQQQLFVSRTDTLETGQHAEAGTNSYERITNCCCQSGWGNSSGGACHYGAARWSKVRNSTLISNAYLLTLCQIQIVKLFRCLHFFVCLLFLQDRGADLWWDGRTGAGGLWRNNDLCSIAMRSLPHCLCQQYWLALHNPIHQASESTLIYLSCDILLTKCLT